MNFELLQAPNSQQQAPDLAAESQKISVILLDQDNLPLARGVATLPVLLGVGVFWPSCPMPSENRLETAKCFSLPTGETMNVKGLKLCAGCPPHYEFRVNRP